MTENYDLYGLAYGCPKLKRKENCPFKGMDGLPFKKKINFIRAFTEEENALILAHHKECSKGDKPEL